MIIYQTMNRKIISVRPKTPRHDKVNLLSRHQLLSVPGKHYFDHEYIIHCTEVKIPKTQRCLTGRLKFKYEYLIRGSRKEALRN